MVDPAFVARARSALEKGNLSAAEGLCVEFLQQAGLQYDVLKILGQTYLALGMKTEAILTARHALTFEPDDAEMRALSGLADEPRPAREDAAQPRFLVIKAWGQGFWSDVTHVLGCCLICEMTGRIPVTDWGANSLFTDGSDRDGFRVFFEPLSAFEARDIAALAAGPVFPAGWSLETLSDQPRDWRQTDKRTGALYFLNRPEQVAVCDFYASIGELAPYLPVTHPMAGRSIDDIWRYLASRYLVLRPEIAAEAEAFFAAHLAGGPVVAVHLRGSDKATEIANLDELNDYLLTTLDQFEPPWRLFAMSDDQRWIERCKARFGDRVVVSACRRTSHDTGIHLQEGDGVALARELLIDCYVALACHRFLGTGLSTVAAMIDILKPWPAGTSTLLGDKSIGRRYTDLYLI